MDRQQKWDLFYGQKIREAFLDFSKTQLDEILSAFPSAKRVLDVGCGEGQLMRELELRGLFPVGIDPSSVALNVARSQTTGILKQGTLEEVSFDFGTFFDIIFVKFVIAFVEDYSVFFEKVDTLLNLNGGLVILTPVITLNEIKGKKEEIFILQSVLDQFLPKYFKHITESVLYTEGDKKLSLYICKKSVS